MTNNRQLSFWGSLSPLGGLTGAGLLIVASARLSWAVTVTGSLFWVYGLTSLTYALLFSSAGKKIFPVKGRQAIYICIASFWGSIYLLLFWLLCPFAALEVLLILLLVPLFCANSGIFDQLYSADNSHVDIFEHVSVTVSQAAILACLLVIFSIIREPLSYCSLSFPISAQGMITIMYFRSGSSFPIGIFASSAGALLLLGYFICLYQKARESIFPGDSL